MKILELPFDEPIGTTVAQDYSGNNHDAVLVGDVITSGRQGNSLYTTQSSFTYVPTVDIDFSGDFSVHFWLMNNIVPFEPVVVYLFFSGLADQAIKLQFFETPIRWTFLAVVKNGTNIQAHASGQRNKGELLLADTFEVPPSYGALEGFFFATDVPDQEREYASQSGTYIDQFVVHNTALSSADLRGVVYNQTTKVAYSIQGVNLRDLGIFVEDARGLIGRPAMKTAKRYDWPDRHGIGIDLKQVRYETRQIELDCWVMASGKDDAVDKVMALKDLISGDNLKRFLFQAGSRYIPYDVYFPEEYEPEIPLWVDGKMSIRFTLVMIEPQPVKRILKFVRTGEGQKKVTITMTTNKQLFSIYWGDGNVTHNVNGQQITVEHTYTNDGEYYITVSGTVERINFFNTNAIITWPRFF